MLSVEKFSSSGTDQKLVLLYSAIVTLILQGKVIMATLSDVQNAVSGVGALITAEKAEVVTAIDGLKTQIATLQQDLANGGVVSAADLDALVASIQALGDQVKGIIDPTAV